MRKSQQVWPHQIKLAQKIISALPEKDDRVSKEKAAELLAEYFRRGFRKGYTAKELSAFLREEGIVIGEQYIAPYQTDCMTASARKRTRRTKKEDAPEKNSSDSGDETKPLTSTNGNQPEVQTKSKNDLSEEDFDDWASPVNKSSVRYGTFEIKPDTPIGDL